MPPEPVYSQPAESDPTAQAPPESAQIAAETLTDPNLPLESGASLWSEGEAQTETIQTQPGQDNTISVEETAPRFKSYNTTVRSAVARHWLLPPEARSNFQPGRFTAVMTLDRQGQVLLIMVEESSGSPSLDYAAMEALRGAAPYEPFPEELVHLDQMSFRLHFDYRAVFRRAIPLD
jgi:TonB family protein